MHDISGTCIEQAFDCFGVGDDYNHQVLNDYSGWKSWGWQSNDALIGFSDGGLLLISPEPDGACAYITQVGIVSSDIISVHYEIDNGHNEDLYTIDMYFYLDEYGNLNGTDVTYQCNDKLEYKTFDMIDSIYKFQYGELVYDPGH
ncbi:MAG: hypothetical protein WC783_00585 [Candidatus Paceibacterota bacterium]